MSRKDSKGKLLIFTAPSGAGKTTIVRHLLSKFDDLAFSVSATNRPPRPGEVHGRDYYFLSEKDFQDRIDAKDFVEYEEVYTGRFYGTLYSEIDRALKEGRSIICDIEVKGATNLKKYYPDNSIGIFVAPPSQETLMKRLVNRNTEDEDSLKARMNRAAEEMTYQDTFDHKLINDDLKVALTEAETIVRNYLGLNQEKVSSNSSL